MFVLIRMDTVRGSPFQWQSLVIPLNMDCIGEYELLEKGNQAYGSESGE